MEANTLRRFTVLTILSLVFIRAVSSDVNLALGRPASQSSDYSDVNTGTGVAGRAVDGNFDGNFPSNSCSVTYDAAGGPNWWKVELAQPERIRLVVVFGRTDCGVCADRLDYIFVGVMNYSTDPVRGSYPLCNQYWTNASMTLPLNITCNPNTNSGQFVVVQQTSNGHGYLTICEIEIYNGTVRNTDIWKRHGAQRLNALNAIYLKTPTQAQCVAECKGTPGCDSINYQSSNTSCELNFDVYGATPGDLTYDPGWNWWSQVFEFI